MKNKTLVVLAAGLGSRFGGLKQMTPVGPNGEFIIDYSIYDAVRCGFNKIVFIIREDFYKEFKNTIGKRIQGILNRKNVTVTYCFQNLRQLDNSSAILAERTKPLGTAHAVLCARESIDSSFIIINSDDFYGYEAFRDASKYIDTSKAKNIGIVGYNVNNTLTKNGQVKRGICCIEGSNVTNIIESSIEIVDNKIIAKPLNSNNSFELPEQMKVSMNMMVFPTSIFNTLALKFDEFIKTADLLNDEFMIPNVVKYKIENDHEEVKLISTESKWVGVTYKEDTASVVNHINELINNKVYPNNLWN